MTIGTNIKRYREEQKMSQTDLADLIDVSQAVISSWESDHTTPNSNYLPKLAKIFDKEIYDLFPKDDSIKYVHNHDNNENSINAFEIKIDGKTLYDDLVNSQKKLISKLEEENNLLKEKLDKNING